jgi:hypothetical protein
MCGIGPYFGQVAKITPGLRKSTTKNNKGKEGKILIKEC